MPLYRCKVINSFGNKQIVFREATDELILKANMKHDNIHMISFKKLRSDNNGMSIIKKVKFSETVTFFRQFAVMINAGVTISDSLDNLRKQQFSPQFKKIITTMYFDIQSGLLLSEAFAKHPNTFSKYFVSMVKIGEISGDLDKILSDMADFCEKDRKLRSKVSSSMIYPMLLISMIFLVVIFLSLFVIPQFETTIKELGGQVPAITQIVLAISQFIKNNFLLILLLIVSIVCTIKILLNTPKGRYFQDYLLLKLPIISNIQINLITSRVSRAFLILINSGMNMTDVLENIKEMMGNEVFVSKFEYTIEEVKRGKSISQSMATTSMFPLLLTEMIDVGEKSGNLKEVLKSAELYFDEQLEGAIAKFVSIIEPIAIIIIGIIVTLVVLSVLIPTMSIMNSI